MAKIPDVTSLGQRPTPKMTFSQPRAQAQQVTGYSQALGAVGKELTDYANEEQEKVDKFNYLKARTDLDKKQNEAILAIESEPDYKKHAKMYETIMGPVKGAMLPSLKGKYQEQFGLDYDGAFNDGLTKVKINSQRKFFEEKAKQADEIAESAIDMAIRSSDPEEIRKAQNNLLNIRSSTPGVTEVESRALIKKDAERIAMGKLAFANEETIAKLKGSFKEDGSIEKTGTIFDNIAPNELFRLVNNRESQILTEKEKDKRVRNEEYNLFSSRVDLAVEQAGSLKDIDNLYEQVDSSKELFGEEKINIEKLKLLKRREKIESGEIIGSLGSDILTGNVQFNPEAKNHKKAIDTAFTKMRTSELFQKLPDEEKLQVTVSNINSINYIPDIVKGEMSVAARSKDTEVVSNAVKLYTSLDKENPFVNQMWGDGANRIKDIAGVVKSGIGINEAIRYVDEKYGIANEMTSEEVKSELAGAKIDYRNKAKKAFETFFTSVSDTPISMSGLDSATYDYRTSFNKHYSRTRDIDLATDLANEDVKNIYGISSVNPGKTLTKYPIERYYSIKGVQGSNWIKELAVETAMEFQKTRNVMNPIDSKDLNENLYIVADPILTEGTITSGGLPAYRLMYMDKNTGTPIDLLSGDLFAPDADRYREKILERKTGVPQDLIDRIEKHKFEVKQFNEKIKNLNDRIQNDNNK